MKGRYGGTEMSWTGVRDVNFIKNQSKVLKNLKNNFKTGLISLQVSSRRG